MFYRPTSLCLATILLLTSGTESKSMDCDFAACSMCSDYMSIHTCCQYASMQARCEACVAQSNTVEGVQACLAEDWDRSIGKRRGLLGKRFIEKRRGMIGK
ncbi:unnamed protein product [Dicrocoelium dendriticum]|nr:unnamed protein product [Dicrocoelium dendriticum]